MKEFLLILLIMILVLLAVLFIIRGVRLRRNRLLREQRRQRVTDSKPTDKVSLSDITEPLSVPVRTDTRYLRNVLGCYVPEVVQRVHSPHVEAFSLTAQEAAAQGFSFHKKSKAVRITNYHGRAVRLVIPAQIDGMPVNEIREEAFAGNRTLQHVEIPRTVTGIGVRAFADCTLEICLIAAQLQSIPASAFENCRNLRCVLLPETLVSIGERAFAKCSALHEIAFPSRCRRFGDYAFWDSGLSGFMTTPAFRVNNGAAFCHTPLHYNYNFVLSSNSDSMLDILLCGGRTETELRFPVQKRIRLGRASMEFCNARYFDLSRCAWVSIDPEAFLVHQVNDGFMRQRAHKELILPKNCEPTYFPKGIQAYCADDAAFPQSGLQGCWDDHAPVSVTTHAAVLPSYGIHGVMTEMIITQAEGLLLKSCRHAFVTQCMVSLKAPLSADSEELFSIRCRSLRKVQFPENGEIITKYIPDRRLIGSLHRELLPAFRGDGAHFFDRSVYDTVFLRGTYTRQDGTIRPLSQKQRLMMCFDVLRSTQRAHEEIPYIYIAYLASHLRYARKLCKKIEPTHPEYLRWLAAQDPAAWFTVYAEAKRYTAERSGKSCRN